MKTLIILHGWQSSKEKWAKVKELLEKQGIKVLAPDLPGFKPETKLDRPWNLDDYVEWLNNLLQSLEGFYPEERSDERVFLLGHSFGGRIAIKFAAQNPMILRGLILVAAAGLKKDNFSRKFWRKLSKIGKNSPFLFKKFFYRYFLRKTDYFQARGFLKETMKNILEEDLTGLLGRITAPTLLVWGGRDKITPLSDGCLMSEKIKNSKIEILENIGHAPHLEAPELLAEKISQFVK